MGIWQRFLLSGMCVMLLACANPLSPQATPTLPATATPVPVRATLAPSATVEATPTASPAPAQRPLHLQIINADAMDATPFVEIIQRNAAMLGIPPPMPRPPPLKPCFLLILFYPFLSQNSWGGCPDLTRQSASSFWDSTRLLIA